MKVITTQQFPSPTYDDDGLADIRAIAEPSWHSTKGVTPKKTASAMPKRKSKKKVKPDERGFRWQVRAWLDANKPDQLDLGRWIHELKIKRTFAPILRNALSLYRELMEGQVDMLYQLFPDVKPPPPMPSAEIEKMQKKIDSLQNQVDDLRKEQIDLLKGMLKQQSPGAVDMTVNMVGQGSPKLLTANKAAPPLVVDDDDELVIRKSETAGAQAGINFVKSAFALNGMTYDESKQ